MNIFDRFKKLLKKEDAVESSLETLPLPAIELPNAELINVSEGVEVLSELEQNELPYWLSSEDALRDEGVIFGLSNAEATDKVAIIRTIFDHQIAPVSKRKEQLSEKIGEINLIIGQKQNSIDDLNGKIKDLNNQEKQNQNLLRTSVGLFFSIAMCVGNYYLIDHSLKNTFLQNHEPIAFGVFLAGMFNLFNPTSVLHDAQVKMNWRSALEEFGIPLAASFFVFVQTLNFQPLVQSLALFVFVFFLFLYSGKLLLSNLTAIKNDFQKWISNQKLVNDKNNQVEIWDSKIADITTEINKLRAEKWQIIPDLNYAEAALNQLVSKRDSLENIFMSEFNLAKNYKNKLSPSQLKNISE